MQRFLIAFFVYAATKRLGLALIAYIIASLFASGRTQQRREQNRKGGFMQDPFYPDVNSDYKILGLDPSASYDEVKKAYRKMAISNHPDKVASKSKEYQKAAKNKFLKIQEAYENIKKNRRFK